MSIHVYTVYTYLNLIEDEHPKVAGQGLVAPPVTGYRGTEYVGCFCLDQVSEGHVHQGSPITLVLTVPTHGHRSQCCYRVYRYEWLKDAGYEDMLWRGIVSFLYQRSIVFVDLFIIRWNIINWLGIEIFSYTYTSLFILYAIKQQAICNDELLWSKQII